MPENCLGRFENDFEVPGRAGGENFCVDVGAAEGLAGVFACEGETDQLLDHLVVCAARVGVSILVVGAG